MYLHESLYILGVDITDGEADIKRAFRQKAKKLHPDVNKNKDAEDQFRQLVEAYEHILNYKNARSPEFKKYYTRPYQKPTYSQEYYNAYYNNYNSFYKKWFEQEEQKKAQQNQQHTSFWDTRDGQRIFNKSVNLIKNSYYFLGLVVVLMFLYYFFKYLYYFVYHLYMPDGSGLAIVLGILLVFFGFILMKTYRLIRTKR